MLGIIGVGSGLDRRRSLKLVGAIEMSDGGPSSVDRPMRSTENPFTVP